MKDSPATITGERVDLEGRDPCFPQLYRVTSHVKIPSNTPTRNIYIYLEDTRPEEMAAKYDASRKRSLPSSTEADIHAAGMRLPYKPTMSY